MYAPDLYVHGFRKDTQLAMHRLINFPLRNLAVVIGALLVVMVCATGAYMTAGWSLKDAIYMVVLTV
jgi:hypothetical protein